MSKLTTIGEYIVSNQKDFPYAKGELSSLLSSIKLATKIVQSKVSKAGLAKNILGAVGETNVQGEEQQKLDVYANDVFISALKARGVVCGVASEENDDFIVFDSEINKNAKYVVCMDPLDGSSNIDVNISVGTIFSIYRRVSEPGNPVELRDFLQKGSEQVAAGYVLYGSSTMLVYCTGQEVNGFTFDPAIGVFFLSHPNLQIPKEGKMYSMNEGNYNQSPQGVKDYLDYCKGIDKDTNRPYRARYVGSLVTDFHRNMLKGGIYMYPSTVSAPKGKLRLLYECNTLAFIAEKAGGKATNGTQRILDIEPTELHQREPFYVGSSNMVDKLEEFLSK